jgi:alkanesulfonate monooxygenase SsuD/methylene tetrahydromethanopterin reductase-like flavin-dependent oxidoreductase (luciferase family)
MYANIVTVPIQDEEQAIRELHEKIVPRVSRAPGFVAGYWLEPRDGQGRGIILFGSEEAARRVAEMALAHNVGPAPITEIETRAVIAHA